MKKLLLTLFVATELMMPQMPIHRFLCLLAVKIILLQHCVPAFAQVNKPPEQWVNGLFMVDNPMIASFVHFIDENTVLSKSVPLVSNIDYARVLLRKHVLGRRQPLAQSGPWTALEQYRLFALARSFQ